MIEVDVDLIKSAKGGDEWAKVEIVTRFKKKVEAYAHRYYLVGGERSDLMQEGYLGLSNALELYDENKGNFAAFALTCVNNQMKNSVKKNRALKNKILNESVSFETVGSEEGLEAESPEALYLQKESSDNLFSLINARLTEPEKEAVLLFIEGFSYKEIAQRTNKSTKSVDNALARARGKLSAALKESEK